MNRIEQVFRKSENQKKPVTVHCVTAGLHTPPAGLARRMEAAGGIWELRGRMDAEALCRLAGSLRRQMQDEVPLILSLSFHQIFICGLEHFTDLCTEAGVDGVRVPDLPMEEQPQLKVYLLKKGAPKLIQEICPQSGDRIPDITAYAQGYVYCTADPALWTSREEYGNPLLFFLYAAEAVCPVPLILDFPKGEEKWLSACLKTAAGMTVKEDIAVPALFC